MLWAQRALIQMLRDLGFGISWDKMSGPAQNNIVYLGVLFDSINMELSIPPENNVSPAYRAATVQKENSSFEIGTYVICGITQLLLIDNQKVGETQNQAYNNC